MVRPIRFRCVGIWISTGLPYVYTRHWPHKVCTVSSDLHWIFRKVATAYVGCVCVCVFVQQKLLWFSRTYADFPVCIEFHENPCSGSRVVPCGWKDRHYKDNIFFSQFCERL
jgi:hypothetical protein